MNLNTMSKKAYSACDEIKGINGDLDQAEVVQQKMEEQRGRINNLLSGMFVSLSQPNQAASNDSAFKEEADENAAQRKYHYGDDDDD